MRSKSISDSKRFISIAPDLDLCYFLYCRLPCSFATYALLGSYTVQSEIGDWDPIEFGTGVDYLHDFDFAPTQNAELLEKIAELHKHHK